MAGPADPAPDGDDAIDPSITIRARMVEIAQFKAIDACMSKFLPSLNASAIEQYNETTLNTDVISARNLSLLAMLRAQRAIAIRWMTVDPIGGSMTQEADDAPE